MGLFRSLFGVSDRQRARLRDVDERLSDVEAQLAGLLKWKKAIQGRLTGGIRHDGEESREDAPGHTIAKGTDGDSPITDRIRRLRGF